MLEFSVNQAQSKNLGSVTINFTLNPAFYAVAEIV